VPAASLDLSRAYPEPLADALPPLVLDRQRIVQSAAFRRLQQKTQVFLALENDHFRTRLTHTLEVAHLARCLADQLGLNVELAEVVALAHDLGHPPFGHSGEQALQACLRQHGGFEHNQHALRIVEHLEHPYPAFPGLNLTHAARECLAKHETQYDRPGPHPLQDGRPSPTEGRLVDVADRIAYGLHDLQDGLYAGLFEPSQLKTLTLWTTASEAHFPESSQALRAHIRPALDRIQTAVVADLRRNYTESQSVWLSPALEARFAELDCFLFEQVYRSERLRAADLRAKQVVTELFETFIAKPDLMPPRYAARVAQQGTFRVVADYLAGMTDRYCLEVHAQTVSRLAGPSASATSS
jgi:dGTPase